MTVRADAVSVAIRDAWDTLDAAPTRVCCPLARTLASLVVEGLADQVATRRALLMVAVEFGADVAVVYAEFRDACDQFCDELALVEARPDATVTAAWMVANAADYERIRLCGRSARRGVEVA